MAWSTIMHTKFVLVSILVTAFVALPAAGQQPPLKVLISADMEGVADTTNWKIDSQPGTRDYAQMRRLMTSEVNAAVTAAMEAGATEVTVADSHGDFANLDPEALDPRCRLIRGWPRPLGMMQGLTADTGAVVFIGYHAPEGTPNAMFAHTFTGSVALHLNGKAVSEGSFNAAVAAELHVPVVFLSGDDQAVADAQANIGPIETVTTKKALGFSAGVMMAPATVAQSIHEGVLRGTRRRAELHPVAPVTPITLEWRFNNVTQAEMVSYLPGSKRSDGNTVLFTVANMAEASRLLTVVDLISSVSHE
ncbi:MAG TPA: M55 family metallopeptidase [Candidatus Sulfotelmatobacter sp.]|nr:M55 family metallopeptidase [Candidatus Sulfotelmatobacter sp.]